MENSVSSQYTFNEKWRLILLSVIIFSEVAYRQFYTLKDNGELNQTMSFAENKDGTFNSWNLLPTVGGFAPGSQLTLLYRNQSSEFLRCSQIKHER